MAAAGEGNSSSAQVSFPVRPAARVFQVCPGSLLTVSVANRRLKKLDDDVRAKEELEVRLLAVCTTCLECMPSLRTGTWSQRKEALERRRREREESDKYLRHPSSAAPEPNKPILRRGAGVKWVACKKQGQPTSPRTKSKLLQAKLRAHIREQRAKIKQQIKENPVAKGSDSEVGLDWKTARKMAADGLDTLLHDVLQEESTPPEAAVTSSPELAAAVQDLNFLLCEMGPPKHLSNSAVPPEHTIGSCLNNVNALECSNDHSCTGLGLRQRRSQRARHRPVPQMFPDKVGIDVPEISIPDISVVNNDEKPRWACLVESSDRVDSPSANPCSSVSNSPLPQWADLVRARCPTFSEDSPISFPPPSWTGEPSTSTAEYKGQEVRSSGLFLSFRFQRKLFSD